MRIRPFTKILAIVLVVGIMEGTAHFGELFAEDVVITIRLINGKNGKPIKDENLNIFRNGPRFAENFRADSNGLIKLTIDRGSVVDFGSNIQVTCHPYNSTDEERATHLPRRYKVDEIMTSGISDQNMCSKKVRVEAGRGEFVFYERPRTFWELMAL